MSSAIEALGMSLPYSSSNLQVEPRKKKQECIDGKAIRILLEKISSLEIS
jgi:dihydroxy-acid dehydratase